jgi:hypothetical protein
MLGADARSRWPPQITACKARGLAACLRGVRIPLSGQLKLAAWGMGMAWRARRSRACLTMLFFSSHVPPFKSSSLAEAVCCCSELKGRPSREPEGLYAMGATVCLVSSRTECIRCNVCVLAQRYSGCSACLIFEGLRPAIEGEQPAFNARLLLIFSSAPLAAWSAGLLHVYAYTATAAASAVHQYMVKG